MKATCSFPITGRRGAKVVTTICLKGFLSAGRAADRFGAVPARCGNQAGYFSNFSESFASSPIDTSSAAAIPFTVSQVGLA